MKYFAALAGGLAAGFLLFVGFAGCNDSATTGGGDPNQAADGGYDPSQDMALRDRLDQVIEACRQRKMNTKDHAAWQVVHGILAYGHGLEVEHNGQVVSALDYLLQGGDLTGWRFRTGEKGLDTVLEAGSKTGQGHDDQWLGYMSQIGMPIDTPIAVRIDGELRSYTIHDLVTQAQWDIRDNTELTWTLMGLGIYLPIDAQWTASNGEKWNIERIVDFESRQDLVESACGGSHRLYGIASALNRYKEELQPMELTGGWLTAENVIQDSIRKIREGQQPDGSFSVKYFERPATSPDISLRLNTTGHQLEFLTMVLTDEQMREPWMVKAVNNLCEAFELTQDMGVECGGLYHGAHGLELYRWRVFGPTEPPTGAAQGESTDESTDGAADPATDAAAENNQPPAPPEPTDDPPAPDQAAATGE